MHGRRRGPVFLASIFDGIARRVGGRHHLEPKTAVWAAWRPSMAARSLVYSLRIDKTIGAQPLQPAHRIRRRHQTLRLVVPGLATTTGAAGTRASRIIERSEACWEIVMARISRARPMALSRKRHLARWWGFGLGRARPLEAARSTATRAPTLAWRRVRYSCAR